MAKKLQVSVGVNTKGYKADWKEVEKITKQSANNVSKQTSQAVESMSSGLKAVTNNSQIVKSALGQVSMAVTGVSLGFGVATLAVDGLTSAFNAMFGDFIKANSAFKSVPKDIDQLGLRAIMRDMDAAIGKNEEFKKSQESIKNAFDNGATSVIKESNAVQLYYKVATDLNQTYSNRKNAIEQLKTIAPSYFSDFTTETILTNKATEAYKLYNKEAIKRARMAGLMSMANKTGEEQAKSMIDLQNELAGLGKRGKDIFEGLDFSQAIGKGKGNLLMAFINTLGVDDPRRESILSTIDEYNYYQKQISSIVDQMAKSGGSIEAPKISTNNTPKQTKTQGQINMAEGFEIGDQSILMSQDKLLGKYSDKVLDTSGAIDVLTSSNDAFVASTPAQIAAINARIAATEKEALAAKELAEKQQLAESASLAVQSAITSSFEQMATSMVNSMGLAANGIDGFFAKLAETAVKTLGVLLSQSIGNAILGATAAGASAGPAAPIVTPTLISTMVGGVLAAFAAIPKFEDGGVVGGTSYTGDKLLARVNSGEVILNTRQQNKLLSLAGSTNGSGTLMTKLNRNELIIWLDKGGDDLRR